MFIQKGNSQKSVNEQISQERPNNQQNMGCFRNKAFYETDSFKRCYNYLFWIYFPVPEWIESVEHFPCQHIPDQK